jgi:hypothetical protein
MIISSASRADVGQVFTFGEGNVEAGSISNSVELNLMKNVQDDRYYSFECKKSGFLKKNHLVFQVVEKGTKDIIVQAEADVKDCKQQLRDIYRVAFERKSHAVVVLSEEANDKGIFELSINYSSQLEVVR